MKCSRGSTDDSSSAAGGAVNGNGGVAHLAGGKAQLSSLLTPTPLATADLHDLLERREGPATTGGFLSQSLSSPLSRSPGHSSPADV